MNNKTEKMWAILLHLSRNQHTPKDDTLVVDDNFWNEFLIKAKETGINTVVLDVGDGVVYKSHPEISVENAWSEERIHSEISKCRDMGITLIPKLNFSTAHNYWMGQYRYMTSTPAYYEFCKDVIAEVAEMFEQPEYMHLGMDEENYISTSVTDYVVFRKGELLIKDLKFLIDEVKKNGAMPWIWHEPLIDYTDIYEKYISPDDAVISPWWYWDYTGKCTFPLISDVDDMYRKQGIVYEQDVPMRKAFMEKILPLMKKGYKYIPAPSNYYEDPTNTEETVRYFKNGSPSEKQIIGFMTAPWLNTTPDNRDKIFESLDLLKSAREKYYSE